MNFKVILDVSKDVDKRFYLNSFEVENFKILRKFIKRGMTVFDVGANIGLYTLLFCERVGENGKVYSFEPALEAFYRLKQNVKLNNYKAKIYNIGISDKIGETVLYTCEDDAYNSLGKKPMKPIIKEVIINTITLDEFCKNEKISTINLIKIDTEGADYLVLKGAERILTKDSAPVIICEYNRKTEDGFDFKVNELYRYLKKLGYYIYEIKNGRLYLFDHIKSTASDIICIKENNKSFFPILK